MENQEKQSPQSSPKPPLATGKRSLILAVVCWAFIGAGFLLSLTLWRLPEPTGWFLLAGLVICFLASLGLLIRAALKKRFDRSLAVAGILLFAFFAFWLTFPLWGIRYSCGDYYNQSAHADALNAYTAAQAYFSDHPEGTAGLEALKSYGLNVSRSVVITVENGTRSGLSIVTRHGQGTKVYCVDQTKTVKRYTLMEQ